LKKASTPKFNFSNIAFKSVVLVQIVSNLRN
jgi:hypothetical protein